MKIFWLEIQNIKYKTLFSEITKLEKQNIVFTPNPEIMLKTLEDEEFKTLLEQANYLTSDGIGLYLAYQILDNNFGKIINYLLLPYYFFNIFFRKNMLYKKYGERICGSDLTKDLVDFAEKSGTKITILDLYNPTDIQKVESQKVFPQKIQKKFPNLQFDYFIYNPEKKEEIIQQIANSDSQMLFSTLWMKRQEQSIIKIMKQAPNLKIGLGIGSSFDYFIGFQKRAPKIWRNIGIEWLYRLLTGPRKFQRMKRLWAAIVVFPFTVLWRKK